MRDVLARPHDLRWCGGFAVASVVHVMLGMTAIGIRKELAISYDDALARVPEALKTEGFGVLTEIDVAATLKKKLDVEFRRYKILGACNPAFAYEALGMQLEIGVMLPCNVIVYERDGGGATVVAVDPMQTVAAQDPKLAPIAAEVQRRLARVIERV